MGKNKIEYILVPVSEWKTVFGQNYVFYAICNYVIRKRENKKEGYNKENEGNLQKRKYNTTKKCVEIENKKWKN